MEQAEAYCRAFPKFSRPDIETWAVDERQAPAGKKLWRIAFTQAGKIVATHVEPQFPLPLGGLPHPWANKRMACYAWAKNREHAVKIGSEKRAQVLATNQWSEDFHEWRRLHPTA